MNYEVHYTDGPPLMNSLKKFNSEKSARKFFNEKVNEKHVKEVSLFKAEKGFYSVLQKEYLIEFWSDDNICDCGWTSCLTITNNECCFCNEKVRSNMCDDCIDWNDNISEVNL